MKFMTIPDPPCMEQKAKKCIEAFLNHRISGDVGSHHMPVPDGGGVWQMTRLVPWIHRLDRNSQRF